MELVNEVNWFAASSIKENKFSFNYGVNSYDWFAQQTNSIHSIPSNSCLFVSLKLIVEGRAGLLFIKESERQSRRSGVKVFFHEVEFGCAEGPPAHNQPFHYFYSALSPQENKTFFIHFINSFFFELMNEEKVGLFSFGLPRSCCCLVNRSIQHNQFTACSIHELKFIHFTIPFKLVGFIPLTNQRCFLSLRWLHWAEPLPQQRP